MTADDASRAEQKAPVKKAAAKKPATKTAAKVSARPSLSRERQTDPGCSSMRAEAGGQEDGS